MQALVSATAHGAEICGVKDRGAPKECMRADFILLNADPLVDIRNTRAISQQQ